ncbi:MAG: Kelch repeat-containing protein, partial [Thermomicrobiales bacterium]
GQVLVVGGETSQDGAAHTLASAEIYDPGTNRWRMAAPPALGRSHHTATLLPNGQVLVVGGDTTDAAGTDAITPTAELYDPASNSWTPAGALAVPRGDHTATMLPNGQVLITGGETQAGGGDTALTSAAEVFDAASRTWTATGALTTGRARHTATLLPDGRVLVVGGETPDSRGDRVTFIAAGASRHLAMAASSSAEIYDPATRTWTPAASLTTPRFGQTAMLLTDGSVLVVGGSATADGQPVATAERYNPVANQWSALPLTGARVEHTATLLRDGSLLIAGGLSAPDVYLATAERFVSRTMRPMTPTPTATPVPTPSPTLTPVPTAPPTKTPVPPTATVPPTPTKPLLPPTVMLPTPAPSATPVPPTATPKPLAPPTNTPQPPTVTPRPPTATPKLPTVTPPPAPTSTPTSAPVPPGTVFGIVRYCTADGCAGAPGAVVVAAGLTATADRAGNYVLVNVPSGQVAVTASYRDRSAQQTVAVPASGRVQADFALK